MVSWASQRRLTYGGIFVLIVALIFVALFYTFFYAPPTCTDNRKNGDEMGVDCGGSCQALCTSEALTPVVFWAKAFNVSGSVYSLVAYVENPNITSYNQKVSYEFKIFDDSNTEIGSRIGTTFIPKNKKFVVFEPGMVIANKIPKRVEFQFTSFGTWLKDTSVDPALTIDYSPLLSTSTSPHIDGTVTNSSLENIPKLELSVLVLDGKENVVASSRTFIDNLRANSNQQFVFTWPKPFDLGVESCDKPLDLAVVLDKSGSMRSESVRPPEPFTTVISVAQSFIQNLLGDDRVAVISFGTNANKESALTPNIESAISAVSSLSLSTTSEQTNIGDGLYLALQELMGTDARTDSNKVLVLLTDGVATEPRHVGESDYPKIYAESIARDINSQGISVYTIGLGKGVNEGFLKGLATDESHYFYAPTKETLSQIYNKIGSALCVKKPNAIRIIYRLPQ